MTKTVHRKGGGQPGNYNALKYSLPRPVGGFYSRFRVVRRVGSVPPKAAREELDHDATLKSLLARDPHNIKLINLLTLSAKPADPHPPVAHRPRNSRNARRDWPRDSRIESRSNRPKLA